MNLEINRELVVSTAHMDPYLANDLDNGFTRSYIERIDYGYMLFTDPQKSPLQTDDYPPGLRPVVRLARIHGCKWVRFDQDGSQVDGLPTYNW